MSVLISFFLGVDFFLIANCRLFLFDFRLILSGCLSDPSVAASHPESGGSADAFVALCWLTILETK